MCFTLFRSWRKVENQSGKTAFFERKNWKLIFSVFTPHGRKEKIQGTYFKISALYFKISQTYFLPSENPFENRGKNADKFRHPISRSVRAHNFGRYAPDLFLFWKRNTTFALILGCLEYEGRHGLLFSIHNNSVSLNFQCFLLLNMNDKSNVIWLTPFWNNRQERVKFLNYVRPFFMYFDFITKR